MIRTSAGPIKAFGGVSNIRNDGPDNHAEYAGAYFSSGGQLLAGLQITQSAAAVTATLRPDPSMNMILGISI